MAEPLSLLSPSSTNRSLPLNSDSAGHFNSPKKRAPLNNDRENQAPSSPWAEDSSPGKSRSPVKNPCPAKTRSPAKEMQDYFARPLTEEALRENEGLTMAIDPAIRSAHSDSRKLLEEDTKSVVAESVAGFAGMDDTCFSAFSAVPNADMTRFANLARSPTKNDNKSPLKHHREEIASPRPGSRNTPSRHRWDQDEEHSSPTPRRQKPMYETSNDTTNLLVDFTDQFIAYPHPSRRSPKKYTTQPDLSDLGPNKGRTPSPSKCPLPPRTPNESRHLANLLDFDLPPAPTPRSIPSITARELESMKSEFLSQISSLSASLRGKEAEVQSLSAAVTDAERRVGEAQEQIRDERGVKETLQGEKADWEKRQGEMQKVLKDVKEEIIRGDREKDSLLQRAQEAEHKREEAEARAVEAEGKVEGLRASTTSSTPQNQTNVAPNSEVEAAVTKVAKELHGLYKSKHEAKVTALKKSYSDRWEKKVRDLTNQIETLTKENEDLRIGRDATMSGVIPNPGTTNNAELENHMKELETELSTLKSELSSVRASLDGTQTENKSLQGQLEASRAETADLIAASEELMLLSQSNLSSSTLGRPPSTEPPMNSSSEGIQRSLSRSTSGSGLKAPGFGRGVAGGESRIGRMGGGGGRERSGSGFGRSGILSNIERMGRGRDKD